MIATRSQQFGLFLISLLFVFVLAENLLFSSDPYKQNLALAFSAPDWAEPLGRDHYGRSNIARLSDAIQTSFFMAITCVLTSAIMGLAAGILAGWKGGWWDKTLSWLVNLVLAMPGLILVLLFGAIVPGSFWILYLAISLILWVEYFRVVRSRVMSLVVSPEVEASQLYGFSDFYIFKRHLWPELKRDIYTLACFGAGNSILTLASIGFLYVGLKPPEAELGLMMVELFRYYQQAPWVLAQPIVVVFLLVMGFHLLAKGDKS
ncbi:dipeptide transport system permease protein DppC [Vibrio nigripulchritudo ATCC 27043]|uniref:ABC transporter permease n=1 Tax=Vibrio nigripulchritudo TaxID=28173 RepID=UPI00021C0D5D|nr:ABC transporter permease [Vibrio nigripulchritudo]EGU61250.1 dipeptide transport system permease protein DppC [Vibrio nigripulchritudo ATCC 27043]KJY72738.1 ABC transporter permease [Vibrio nigripulchritudo]CCN34726.1 putative ABC-type dipeptide/oligopeptide/nickel transport systems, permease component [Vibrio nigripulchritudo AM115]CCN44457.1 putative ABC-type dipeptide/oligopeptide/nickel transport systems, permease component [Vibrio nigripulchritudo FTn2]CCN63364.1 putative ABC-type dipe